MTRRHTEWVNLVNSNADSKTPRGKRELLQELDTWERTQGRSVPINHSQLSNSIMEKDFDGAAWMIKHDDNFKRLIAEARKKARPPKEVPEEVDASIQGAVTTPSAEQVGMATSNGDINGLTVANVHSQGSVEEIPHLPSANAVG